MLFRSYGTTPYGASTADTTPTVDRSYGIASYSTTPYGETTRHTTGNIYRIDVEIAPLARIREYADRGALFADLTPDTTQL